MVGKNSNIKKIYWVLPVKVERKVYERFNRENVVISIQALAFDLIKGQAQEGDVTVITPIGDLVYRPRMSRSTGQQMTKRFNATKTFCKKLYPKVTRKLFADDEPITFDFSDEASISAFMKMVVSSDVILGITGQEGKKGILKRVSPVSPLRDNGIADVQSSLLEATEFFASLEYLIDKLGRVEDDLLREMEYDKIDMLLN